MAVNRQKIYEITQGKCFYCGCELNFKDFHIDHFKSRATGGKQSKNLVPACSDCNYCKGKMDIEDFRIKLQEMLEDKFVGRLIKKYYGVNNKTIKFYFEEVKDGNLQNSINVILDRQ